MLPVHHRLRSNQEFQQIYRRGRSWAHPLLILYVLDQPTGKQLGISVSKKVGKANVRNHVRRRIREIVRPRLPDWHEGFAAIVVARPSAAEAAFTDLEGALLELVRRARIPREPNGGENSLYCLPERNPRATTQRGKSAPNARRGEIQEREV